MRKSKDTFRGLCRCGNISSACTSCNQEGEIEITAERISREFDLSFIDWGHEKPKEFSSLSIEITQKATHTTNLDSANVIDSKYFYAPFTLDNTDFFVAGIQQTVEHYHAADIVLETYYIGCKECYVLLGIERSKETEDEEPFIRSSSTLVKYDDQNMLPRGFGRQVADKYLDICQKIANKEQVEVVDFVEKDPGHGGVELSDQEWDRLFHDQLIQRGYDKVSDDLYCKSYFPEI